MTMTKILRSALALAIVFSATALWAQDTIYRCGNEYTNDAVDAKARGCKVVIGGNVTVIQSNKPTGAAKNNAAQANAANQKIDNAEQRARDADAKAILEAELRKAETNLEQLRREYNDGQPERLGSETKNYQKYLERVALLRGQITRSESDIASLKREIARAVGRAPGATP
jgi:chromosome segregation ATPase